MIGYQVRGIRHLHRIMPYSTLRHILIKSSTGDFEICAAYKLPAIEELKEQLFIFTSFYSNSSIDVKQLLKLTDNRFVDILSRFPRIINIEHKETYGEQELFRIQTLEEMFSGIILLPENFEDDFLSFAKANSKLFSNLQNKFGLLLNKSLPKALYALTDGSKNFFQWAINLCYREQVSPCVIKNILSWNNFYGNLTKNLKKNTITAYTNRTLIHLLINEMRELTKEKRIVDAINMFNTTQKNILRANANDSSVRDNLSVFATLSFPKQKNFIKKVSSIDDSSELIRQLKFVTSTHFDWNMQSLIDFIYNVNDLDCEVILNCNNIVLIKVNDFDTIKHLAKTTNWCISKNKTYWNNYITRLNGNSQQFILFNFNKQEDSNLSVIGFTITKNKGITAAHDFTNKDILKQETSTLNIKSYSERFRSYENIYMILKNNGIDVESLIPYDKSEYEWNRDAFMEYVGRCVSDLENIDILVDNAGKLCISVKDKKIKKLFGKNYDENIIIPKEDYQHLIFADFNRSRHDYLALNFAIIYDGVNEEEYCYGLYNSDCSSLDYNFENKLIDFSLPYDIIKRQDNIDNIAINAFLTYNAELLRLCIKKDSSVLDRMLKEHIDIETVEDVIKYSMLTHLSFDYINIIYGSGKTLSEYVSIEGLSSIIGSLYSSIKNIGFQIDREKLNLPTKEDITRFYEEKIEDLSYTTYVGHYLMLKQIIQSEHLEKKYADGVYISLVSLIGRTKQKGTLISDLIDCISSQVSMKEGGQLSSRIVDIVLNNNDRALLEKLGSLYSWIKQPSKSVSI